MWVLRVTPGAVLESPELAGPSGGANVQCEMSTLHGRSTGECLWVFFPCPCFQDFLSHTVVTWGGGGKQPFFGWVLLFFGTITPFREPLGAKGYLKKSPKEEWERAGISWPGPQVLSFPALCFPEGLDVPGSQGCTLHHLDAVILALLGQEVTCLLALIRITISSTGPDLH